MKSKVTVLKIFLLLGCFSWRSCLAEAPQTGIAAIELRAYEAARNVLAKAVALMTHRAERRILRADLIRLDAQIEQFKKEHEVVATPFAPTL